MNTKLLDIIIAITIFISFPAVSFASEEAAATINSGDTAFMIIATAMVLIMTPALGLFYGGMERPKNMINILMMSVILMGITSVQWVLFGYSIAFGPTVGGFFGDTTFWGFNGVGVDPSPDYAPNLPHVLFSMFQMVFVMITPAIISGAVAGRMRFGAYVLLMIAWITLVYEPICHMVWAIGGFIGKMGALDFAGGTVVHISSGTSALVAALMIGKRRGISGVRPHNVPFMLLGGGLLWFGWLAFCGGCATVANGFSSLVIMNTNTAAGAGMLTWLLIEKLHHGKVTLLGAVTGAVAGLVGITPSCGFVTTLSSIAIGILTAPVCYIAIIFAKKKLGYDDALDAFGLHGVGGIWGALLTGVFCTTTVNKAGTDGLFYGNAAQLIPQLGGVLVTIVWAGVATFLILKVISIFTPLRATDEEEKQGMDLNQHGETAYSSL